MGARLRGAGPSPSLQKTSWENTPGPPFPTAASGMGHILGSHVGQRVELPINTSPGLVSGKQAPRASESLREQRACQGSTCTRVLGGYHSSGRNLRQNFLEAIAAYPEQACGPSLTPNGYPDSG